MLLELNDSLASFHKEKKSMNNKSLDLLDIGSDLESDNSDKLIKMNSGDQIYDNMRKILKKLLPTISEEQQKIWRTMEITCAQLIYRRPDGGNDLSDNFLNIMKKRNWASMNYKSIIFGSRRCGKTTITSLFITILTFLVPLNVLILANTQKTSNLFMEEIKKILERLDENFGEIRYGKNNNSRVIFKSKYHHERKRSNITALSGSKEISFFFFIRNIKNI